MSYGVLAARMQKCPDNLVIRSKWFQCQNKSLFSNYDANNLEKRKDTIRFEVPYFIYPDNRPCAPLKIAVLKQFTQKF